MVVGASRKRFLGKLTGRPERDRAAGTVAANVLAFERGAAMFRVHDVAPTRDALGGGGCYFARAAMDDLEGRGVRGARGSGEDGLESSDSSVTVEISGLSLFTHHGVTDAEQQTGQRLVFDIAFEVEDCDATVTDRLEDTIDYAAVCQAVALIATERSYRTLERLCTAVADMLEERFSATGVDRARDQARAADSAAGRGGLGRGRALSKAAAGAASCYLGLGSNVGDRLANLRGGGGACSTRIRRSR